MASEIKDSDIRHKKNTTQEETANLVKPQELPLHFTVNCDLPTTALRSTDLWNTSMIPDAAADTPKSRKRMERNQLEKIRKDKIKEIIDKIARTVPAKNKHEKPSTLSVVSSALECILELKKEKEELWKKDDKSLVDEVQRLRKEVSALTEQCETYKRLVQNLYPEHTEASPSCVTSIPSSGHCHDNQLQPVENTMPDNVANHQVMTSVVASRAPINASAAPSNRTDPVTTSVDNGDLSDGLLQIAMQDAGLVGAKAASDKNNVMMLASVAANTQNIASVAANTQNIASVAANTQSVASVAANTQNVASSCENLSGGTVACNATLTLSQKSPPGPISSGVTSLNEVTTVTQNVHAPIMAAGQVTMNMMTMMGGLPMNLLNNGAGIMNNYPGVPLPQHITQSPLMYVNEQGMPLIANMPFQLSQNSTGFSKVEQTSNTACIDGANVNNNNALNGGIDMNTVMCNNMLAPSGVLPNGMNQPMDMSLPGNQTILPASQNGNLLMVNNPNVTQSGLPTALILPTGQIIPVVSQPQVFVNQPPPALPTQNQTLVPNVMPSFPNRPVPNSCAAQISGVGQSTSLQNNQMLNNQSSLPTVNSFNQITKPDKNISGAMGVNTATPQPLVQMNQPSFGSGINQTAFNQSALTTNFQNQSLQQEAVPLKPAVSGNAVVLTIPGDGGLLTSVLVDPNTMEVLGILPSQQTNKSESTTTPVVTTATKSVVKKSPRTLKPKVSDTEPNREMTDMGSIKTIDTSELRASTPTSQSATDILAQAAESIFSEISPTIANFYNPAHDDNPLHIDTSVGEQDDKLKSPNVANNVPSSLAFSPLKSPVKSNVVSDASQKSSYDKTVVTSSETVSPNITQSAIFEAASNIEAPVPKHMSSTVNKPSADTTVGAIINLDQPAALIASDSLSLISSPKKAAKKPGEDKTSISDVITFNESDLSDVLDQVESMGSALLESQPTEILKKSKKKGSRKLDDSIHVPPAKKKKINGSSKAIESDEMPDNVGVVIDASNVNFLETLSSLSSLNNSNVPSAAVTESSDKIIPSEHPIIQAATGNISTGIGTPKRDAKNGESRKPRQNTTKSPDVFPLAQDFPSPSLHVDISMSMSPDKSLNRAVDSLDTPKVSLNSTRKSKKLPRHGLKKQRELQKDLSTESLDNIGDPYEFRDFTAEDEIPRMLHSKAPPSVGSPPWNNKTKAPSKAVKKKKALLELDMFNSLVEETSFNNDVSKPTNIYRDMFVPESPKQHSVDVSKSGEISISPEQPLASSVLTPAVTSESLDISPLNKDAPLKTYNPPTMSLAPGLSLTVTAPVVVASPDKSKKTPNNQDVALESINNTTDNTTLASSNPCFVSGGKSPVELFSESEIPSVNSGVNKMPDTLTGNSRSVMNHSQPLAKESANSLQELKNNVLKQQPRTKEKTTHDNTSLSKTNYLQNSLPNACSAETPNTLTTSVSINESQPFKDIPALDAASQNHKDFIDKGVFSSANFIQPNVASESISRIKQNRSNPANLYRPRESQLLPPNNFDFTNIGLNLSTTTTSVYSSMTSSSCQVSSAPSSKSGFSNPYSHFNQFPFYPLPPSITQTDHISASSPLLKSMSVTKSKQTLTLSHPPLNVPMFYENERSRHNSMERYPQMPANNKQSPRSQPGSVYDNFSFPGTASCAQRKTSTFSSTPSTDKDFPQQHPRTNDVQHGNSSQPPNQPSQSPGSIMQRSPHMEASFYSPALPQGASVSMLDTPPLHHPPLHQTDIRHMPASLSTESVRDFSNNQRFSNTAPSFNNSMSPNYTSHRNDTQNAVEPYNRAVPPHLSHPQLDQQKNQEHRKVPPKSTMEPPPQAVTANRPHVNKSMSQLSNPSNQNPPIQPPPAHSNKPTSQKTLPQQSPNLSSGAPAQKSSARPKRSKKPTKSSASTGSLSSAYPVDMDFTSYYDSSRCVTPYFPLSMSPPSSRNLANDGPLYMPPNFFSGPPRGITNTSTSFHKNSDFGPSINHLLQSQRPSQNGFGLNFQPGLSGMNHHNATAQIMAHSNNMSSAGIPNFAIGNIFSDMSSANPSDPNINISPMKFHHANSILPPPMVDPNSLQHGNSSLYHNRPSDPPGFHNFNLLGHNHPGFDGRTVPQGLSSSMPTPFHGHSHPSAFPMPPHLNFMHTH